jgi:hypothetical protein
MPDALWKKKERLVAQKIGGKRYPIHGQDHADVESDFLVLEVFMRKKVPEVELIRLDRARRIAGPNRLGGVVRTQPGTSKAIISFDLDDFCDWFVGKEVKE